MNGLFGQGPQRLVRAYWRYLAIALFIISGFKAAPVLLAVLSPVLVLLVWVYLFSRMRL